MTVRSETIRVTSEDSINITFKLTEKLITGLVEPFDLTDYVSFVFNVYDGETRVSNVSGSVLSSPTLGVVQTTLLQLSEGKYTYKLLGTTALGRKQTLAYGDVVVTGV